MGRNIGFPLGRLAFLVQPRTDIRNGSSPNFDLLPLAEMRTVARFRDGYRHAVFALDLQVGYHARMGVRLPFQVDGYALPPDTKSTNFIWRFVVSGYTGFNHSTEIR